MSYFSCGARRGRFNLGNTVLVNLTSDEEFFLGYLQDIIADQVFIDFDCERIAPQWVSMQRVWHHDKPSITLQLSREVYVAIRREADGPYVFGPAFLECSCNYANQFLCYAFLDHPCYSFQTQDSVRVVHSWQVIPRLPSDPMIDRICRLPIKKVVYRSAKLRALSSIQEWHIERILDLGFRQGKRQSGQGRDRLFVKLTDGEIVFLIMRIQCSFPHTVSVDCLQSTCWLTATTRKVIAGIEEYLLHASRTAADLRNFRHRSLPSIAVLSSPAARGNEPTLPHLLPEILSTVMYYLDVVSQGKLKRVCQLWNVLLRDPASSTHVTIDFCTLSLQLQQRAETEGYRLGLLLDRIVNAKTKTVALVNMSYRMDNVDPVIALVVDVLIINRIILPLVIVKNYWAPIVRSPYGLYNRYTPDLSERRKIHFQLLFMKKICRRIIVLNAVINCGAGKGALFPFRTQKSARPMKRNGLIIAIPKLHFDQSESDAEYLMRFKQALERSCPPVDPSVKRQIKELHAGWVKRFPYPGDDWNGLRHLLQLFGVCEAADPAQFWNGLDLRDFDNLPMGNVVLTILARVHTFILSFPVELGADLAKLLS